MAPVIGIAAKIINSVDFRAVFSSLLISPFEYKFANREATVVCDRLPAGSGHAADANHRLDSSDDSFGAIP